MGKKEAAEAINDNKKMLKKDKKKRKKQKTDQDDVSSAERLEENEEIASDNDRIDKKRKLKADLTEGVSADTDGVESCTSTTSKHVKKKRKKEKEDCIFQGEMSEEDGNEGCGEIMAETEESPTAIVQNSEDEASKKSKKKKKKKKRERVEDYGQNYSHLDSTKPKEKTEVEDTCSSSFMDSKKVSDSEGVEIDNRDVSEVKRKGESRNGGEKREQKNELVNSEDMETGATNDDSPGEEKEPVKKKKKKSKEKDKAKNRLVEDKETPELSEKDDDAVPNQWQSAEFGDTGQKEKFLRLLGGNKPSNKQRPASSYSVMAMNSKQEKVLSNSLEKQFLQALQTRKERGLGLGYN